MRNTAAEMRDKALHDRVKMLVKALDEAGLDYAKLAGYGDNKTREKVTSWTDAITVFMPDGRVVARIQMNTGTGWHSSFQSWQLRLPTYTPRGVYNQAEYRRDPANSQRWGFGNIKSTGDVIKKIKDAMDFVPNGNDIEVGKLRRKIESLGYDAKRAISEYQYAFRDQDVVDEIVKLVQATTDTPISEKLAKKVRKADAELAAHMRIMNKRKKLWAKIDELEGDNG